MGIKKVHKTEALELSKQKCLEVLNVLIDICEQHNITYWLDGGTLLGAVRHGGMIPWDDDIDVCFPETDYSRLLDILYEFSQGDNPYVVCYKGSGFEYCYDYFGDSSVLVDGIFPARVDLVCVKYVTNTSEAIAIDNSWANVACLYAQGKPKNPNRILPMHECFLPKGKNLFKEKKDFFEAYQDYLKESMSLSLTCKSEDLLLYYATNDYLVKRERSHFRYDIVFPLSTVVFEGRTFSSPNNKHDYLVHLYGQNYMQLPPREMQISHMNFMTLSTVNKWKWHRFLIDFYKSGFLNLALSYRNKSLFRPILTIKNFIKLLFKCIFRGHFSMAKGLIFYSLNKVKK